MEAAERALVKLAAPVTSGAEKLGLAPDGSPDSTTSGDCPSYRAAVALGLAAQLCLRFLGSLVPYRPLALLDNANLFEKKASPWNGAA